METIQLFGTEKISRILLKLAPPVMLAQLIQALYNIIDSLFIGRYSDTGLTALSIIYPLQLLMIALAVGTGVGINTAMASKLGEGSREKADEFAGLGTPIAIVLWAVFAAVCWMIMPAYAGMSTSSPQVIRDVVIYGRIVCVFSFALFLESIWAKVLQANGDMKTPMLAQIAGAITNIIIDPLLIFGMFGLPELGIAGAAIATVIGQMVAAAIMGRKGYRKAPPRSVYPQHLSRIFHLGIPNILMQSAYTFYILGLNLILSGFCDQAVTALGLYYKWQTFFFIPLGAMQTCIVPIISFNYAARKIDRCKNTLTTAILFGMALMLVGTTCFLSVPTQMLQVFTDDPLVLEIGTWGFRIIGLSFLPQVTSLIFPVFFQAVGSSLKSSMLTLIRTVVLFVPLGFLFSRIGLSWFWLTYPVTEILTTAAGVFFYSRFLRADYVSGKKSRRTESAKTPTLKPSSPGVIITISREHGSGGKQIGKLAAQKLGIPFYYKEMIALAAQDSGLDRDFLSDIHKNSPDVLRDMYLSSYSVRYAIKAQNQTIRRIADCGSCVIVGRAADHVLKHYDNVVRIYVHAPTPMRIDRVMEIYGDTPEQAARNIRRSDKARASYYKHISGKRWGEAKNYELVLDSSIGIEKCAEAIAGYVKSHT